MIRVLQVAGLARGGLETFIMNVYRKIDRSQIQFDFLVMDTAVTDYESEIIGMGGRIFKLPARGKGVLTYYRNVNSFFKEHAKDYAAIHYHSPSLSNALVLFYAKKYGINIRLAHSHSSRVLSKLQSYVHKFMKFFIVNWATHYLGCSDKALDWFYGGTSIRQQAQMINNGIDVNLFKYNSNIRDRVRAELNISQYTVLGHVGRFMSVKNHKFLVDIFSEYHKLNPISKLMLIGVGELTNETKDKVTQLGLEDDVLFMGLRTDINVLLQAMDIFVMPSLHEGLPVSLVEAQASGLPVLAADTISQDTKMTDCFYYYSLNETAESWANKVQEIQSKYKRGNQSDVIVKRGFDINTTSILLSEIYLGKS